MWSPCRLSAGAAMVVSLFVSSSFGAPTTTPPVGTTAHYIVLGSGERSKPLVAEIRLTAMDVRGAAGHDEGVGWQLDIALTDGRQFAIRGNSDAIPMTTPQGCGEFYAYILQLPDGGAFEYSHERTDRAQLPPVAFRELFLPTPTDEPVLVDGFACAGTFLGHVLILDRVDRASDPTFDAKKDGPLVPFDRSPTLLKLRPDLLIGTSRSFKDDGTGRADEEANYTYIPFVETDYDEMIAAGANYFGVKDDQLQWVRHRPVFYRGSASWPEDFYRGNYVPGPMFSDEPMIRLGWQEITPDELDHPQQMASFLQTRVRDIYNTFGMNPLSIIAQYLGRSGISMPLQTNKYILAPTWETMYETAFYELAGGAPGIVHEGRYVEENYGWHPTLLFGPGLKVTTREMLLCYYAFLRGAARAHDGQWGTAIYGHSDPSMRMEALTLAYDMGARYLWFWTSDHTHHVPYVEQLALTRGLMEHARKHPRGDLTPLRRGAKVAIAFPPGYTLSWGNMFGEPSLSYEVANRTGTPYREVVAAAMWEGVLCAKKGIPFDFTIQHENLENLGYGEILLVGEDAKVTAVPNRASARPMKPEVHLAWGKAEPATDVEKVENAIEIPHRGVRAIDGDLSDWKDALWLSHDEKPSATGEWDGPDDLSTEIALGCDMDRLLVAARVRDDVHSQPFYGWDMWKGDSLQIGFDPLNEENEAGYSGNQHEIGFVLLDSGRALAFRWHGRRGQPLREMPQVEVSIKREGGVTVYEAAIPLSDLKPLSPLLTPVVGLGVTLNDADTIPRESHHETSPGSMTAGKYPKLFRKARLSMPAKPRDPRRHSGSSVVNDALSASWVEELTGPSDAAIIWHQTVARVGGEWTFDCLTRSHRFGQDGRLTVTLEPLSPLVGLPGFARDGVRLYSGLAGDRDAARAFIRPVSVQADAPPGRYRLTAEISAGKELLTRESMTVFLYPAGDENK